MPLGAIHYMQHFKVFGQPALEIKLFGKTTKCRWRKKFWIIHGHNQTYTNNTLKQSVNSETPYMPVYCYLTRLPCSFHTKLLNTLVLLFTINPFHSVEGFRRAHPRHLPFTILVSPPPPSCSCQQDNAHLIYEQGHNINLMDHEKESLQRATSVAGKDVDEGNSAERPVKLHEKLIISNQNSLKSNNS